MDIKGFYQKHASSLIFFGLAFLIPLFLFTLAIGNDQKTSQPPSQKAAPPSWQTYEELVSAGKLQPAGKILEVIVAFDQHQSPQLQIKAFNKKNGYVPMSLPEEANKAQLLNANGQVIAEKSFAIPRETHAETTELNEEGTLHGKTEVLERVSFALTLSWQDNAAAVRLLDEDGNQITIANISDVHVEDNKPEFQSIEGDALLNQKKVRQGLLVDSALAQAADGKIDVVFVSNNFTDMNRFIAEAKAIPQGFLRFEPFKTRASQFRFHILENTDNVGCFIDTRTVPVCDHSLVNQRVNTAGVPHDYIVVLYNAVGGGTGGSIAVIGDSDLRNIEEGTPPWNVKEWIGGLMAHEFGGHAMGKLMDEYPTIQADGALDNKIHMVGGVGDGNCYAGVPPAAEWNKLNPPVPLTAYGTRGCTFRNWRPSSVNSNMSAHQICFNPVSQGVLNRRMDLLAGAFPGGHPPVERCAKLEPYPPSTVTPLPNEVIKCQGQCPKLPPPGQPAPTSAPSVPTSIAPTTLSIVPTYQCLGGIPCNPTATPPAPTIGSPTESPNPTTAPPCTNETQNTVQHDKKKSKSSGGFLEQFFLLLIKLIELLFGKSGTIPNPPLPTPTPCP
jgi:hypothetical protein